MENKDIQSILKLERIVFETIEFKRINFSSDHELKIQIQSNIAQKQNGEVYKVTLTLKGDKPEEYTFDISLSGFFTIQHEEGISEETKKMLITKNTIAILMPYLRSEVSLLTAQPGVDCVILPPFNINKILDER